MHRGRTAARPKRGALGRLVGIAVAATLVSGPGAVGATYYVSTEGDDGNGGLSREQQLRTIQTAVDRAQAGDTVVVSDGVYREQVTFSRSGEAGRPITVTADEGARVVVSGCEPIAGWEMADEAKSVWKAPMPWTLGTGRDQVFANGDVLIEARFPNDPAPGLEMYVADLSPLWPTFGEFSIPRDTAADQPGRIVSPLLAGQPDDYWKGGIYYGVHYEGWCAQTGVIESSKSGEITVGDRTTTWWFASPYGEEEGRGMIVGHYNALDQPGEWVWLDGWLYLIAPNRREPAGIEAKARQLAFELSGREHIHIRGIEVHAASMRLADAAYCVVENCSLRYISHFTRQYGIGQVEHDRDTVLSGETGILVSGHDNLFANCVIQYSAGAGFHLRGYHHTIHNCLIDEVDYTSHYLNAITDAVADFPVYEHQLVGGHVITYNTMRNAGRHFFNFHGNGTSLASRDRGPMDYMATLFAHNHLYNGMLQTRDAGLITGYYGSGGTLNGLNSQVVHNVIHDSYDIFAMRIGLLGLIYLDAGTCDVDVRNNLLWAAPGSLQRGLWFNTMCVDIHETDNVFHREFTRTCAELEPSDFPRGIPFRFGHDFQDPPPIPAWPPVRHTDLSPKQGPPVGPLLDGDVVDLGEVNFDDGWQTVVAGLSADVSALNADKSARQPPRHTKATDPLVLEAVTNDGMHHSIGTQWTFVRNTNDGTWIRFAGVPLGNGYRQLRIVYGKAWDAPSSIEVRLDAVDGPLVGTAALLRTDLEREGSVQIYGQAFCDIGAEAKSTRDVFIVFRSENGKPAGEFEYFRFEGYRAQVPLQPQEVRLELRTGAPDGPTIGVLFPTSTGGTDQVRAFVGSLTPVAGLRRLYLVVRSAVDGPTCSLHWIRLERADPDAWPAGLGAAPRMRDGRMVLPEPTHRPRARPNDRYPRAVSTFRPRTRLGEELEELAAAGPPPDGLILWMDAADAATVVLDEAGRVALWRDRSGTGRHAVQAVPAVRPRYDPVGLNGKPALRFDEQRMTRLEAPDLYDGRGTPTILAVFSNPDPYSQVNHDSRILTASDGQDHDYLVGVAATVPGMETGGPRVGAWVFSDRFGQCVRIGCFSPEYQTYFTGWISEILVWDRPLTELEQDRALAYLVTKWNIAD